MKFFTGKRLALKVLILMAVAAALVFARQDGAPVKPTGYTGGFGEPDCTACHFTYSVDQGRGKGGAFELVDVPDEYVPGETYTITLRIAQPMQSRWGFQIAARFMEDGSPAGAVTITDLGNTQLRDREGIQYVTHTNEGTYPGLSEGPVEWKFDWTAPENGTVVFNAAGNAANNDSTQEGDYIYVTSKTVTPQASDK